MAAKLPPEFINELLTRTDLVELIHARVNLKKEGIYYKACCPFHQEKTPSFVVHPQKQFFHCYGCGENGNAINFLMRYDRLEFLDVIDMLAALHGLEIPTKTDNKSSQHLTELRETNREAARFYYRTLQHTPHAKAYLTSRGIPQTSIKQYGLGYAPNEWDGLLRHFQHKPHAIKQLVTTGLAIDSPGKRYDRFRNRIIFPIRDSRGQIIGFGGRIIDDGQPKYLNSPETPLFHKRDALYGFYEARQANSKLTQLIVVEGYMDVIALAHHGFTNAVASMGTAITNKHVQKLFRYVEELIFCFDGDVAGQKAAWKALETALPLMRDGVSVRFMFLPESEDPDSLLQKHGAEHFTTLVKSATELSSFFFKYISQSIDINTINGKSRFARAAANYLQKMPRGVYQQLLFDELAKQIDLERDQLERLLTSPETEQKNAPALPEKQPTVSTSISTTMHTTLSLLIQNPQLLNEISLPPRFSLINLPGSELLHQLIEIITKHPEINTGTLLSYWYETPELDLLSQLAKHEHLLPSEGWQAELNESVQRLMQLNREYHVQQLLKKAKSAPLTAEEKHALKQLLER